MGLNSGPVFWSHFFTFLECTSLLLNTQNKHKTGTSKINFFLVSSQGSLKMLHTWRQRQQQYCVECTKQLLFFPTLWRPLQHLAKNLNNFRTQKRACGWHRKLDSKLVETATMETWTIGGTLETDRKRQKQQTQEIQSTPQTTSKAAKSRGNLHKREPDKLKKKKMLWDA